MNKAKARDFFSDYYEGSLDAGLKQVFERALASDSSLREDYESFCLLMKDLDALQDEVAPEPAFLSERIASRIEQKLGQEASPRRSSWWLGWGKWAFAGAAAFAILSLLAATASQPGQFVSSFLPWVDKRAEEPARAAIEGGALKIQAVASELMLVTVRTAKTGETLDRVKVDAWQKLNMPLLNESERAEIILVEFSNGRPAMRLALPGTKKGAPAKGSGRVDDLALALADSFQLPVLIETASPNMPVNWDLGTGSPSAATVVSAHGAAPTIDEIKGPLLVIN